MKNYLLFLSIALNACVLNTETSNVSNSEEDYASDSSYLEQLPSEGTEPKYCLGDTKKYNLPNGDEVVINLPGWCQEFYLYTGYPNPVKEYNNPYTTEQEINQKEIINE